MEVYDGDIAVSRKADASPLTQADMAAHHIIVDGLARLTPEWPVLSEESEALPFEVRQTWRRYWLVDPLDGTREFIKRNGEFTVNIALIEEHQPVLGVVYAPALNLLFYAAKGGGAWRQLGDREPQRIRARDLDPTQVTVAGSRSHADARLTEFLSRIGPHMLISMGSSLKICLVAEGRADVYPRLGPTSEWDTAAAQCVLEEAGGRLVGADNQPFRYNAKAGLLNPDFFATGASSQNWANYL
jgi:3'(2'), 5'-bisphosphate nucleotidase